MTIARRFSIGLLMTLIGFAAANLALLRSSWNNSAPISPGAAIFILPVVNLLFWTGPKLRRGFQTRPYWAAFHLVGWLLVLAVIRLSSSDPESFFAPLISIERKQILPAPFATTQLVTGLQIACLLLLYATPLVLAALLAGHLNARYRLVIERRSGPVVGGPTRSQPVDNPPGVGPHPS